MERVRLLVLEATRIEVVVNPGAVYTRLSGLLPCLVYSLLPNLVAYFDPPIHISNTKLTL